MSWSYTFRLLEGGVRDLTVYATYGVGAVLVSTFLATPTIRPPGITGSTNVLVRVHNLFAKDCPVEILVVRGPYLAQNRTVVSSAKSQAEKRRTILSKRSTVMPVKAAYLAETGAESTSSKFKMSCMVRYASN